MYWKEQDSACVREIEMLVEMYLIQQSSIMTEAADGLENYISLINNGWQGKQKFFHAFKKSCVKKNDMHNLRQYVKFSYDLHFTQIKCIILTLKHKDTMYCTDGYFHGVRFSRFYKNRFICGVINLCYRQKKGHATKTSFTTRLTTWQCTEFTV